MLQNIAKKNRTLITYGKKGIKRIFLLVIYQKGNQESLVLVQKFKQKCKIGLIPDKNFSVSSVTSLEQI